MRHGHDRAHPEAEAEPQADVHEDARHREDEGVDAALPQLLSDDRADELLSHHLEAADAARLQRGPHRLCALLQARSHLGSGLRQADHHLVRVRIAVLLHDLLALYRGQRVAHRVLGYRLVEFDDDEAAAGEVDAQRQPAAHEQQGRAHDDNHQRCQEGLPAPGDEVEIRLCLEKLHPR